jgi:DNA-binding HxlR family transcriptional regulator
MSTNRESGDAPLAPLDERRLMAAHPVVVPDAHERRLAERTRSARLIRDSICLLSSKWSVDILLALGDGTRRYHELLEDLQPISEKVLTQTLRGMERDGLVARRVHAEVPPRVEYALTEKGRALVPIIESMRSYGTEWLGAEGSCVEAPEPAVPAAA